MNNTQIDNVKDNDVAMPMYHLIDYNDNYSKTRGSLWQYYRDEPVLTDASAIANFTSNYISDSFYFKEKITGKTNNNGTKMFK